MSSALRLRTDRPQHRHLRGAARISIVWMIAMIVVALVCMVMAYLGYEDKSRAEEATKLANARAIEADQRTEADAEALLNVSKLVGFFDPAAPIPRTRPEAVSAAFAELKATFTDLGPEVKTIADALPVVQRRYNDQVREVSSLKEQLAAAQNEKSTAAAAHAQVVQQKDTLLRDLEKTKADELATADARQSELEQRLASITQSRDQFSADAQKVKAQLEEQSRKFDEERSAFAARMKNMAESLKFLDEPEAKDATVLAVSSSLPYGWIDIGANQRLAAGTRFHVVSGKLGSKVTKAWAEVTRVEADKSEVTFFDLTDRFDPAVPGDILFNPVYDPVGERHAVLAGRFSGLYSESELKVLLERLNIKVQPKLDVNTDYLIVGSEMYVDEEGNAVETPIQPSELPVYRNAEAQGVLIMPVKDLYGYFKY
jgi:hypothetical protein